MQLHRSATLSAVVLLSAFSQLASAHNKVDAVWDINNSHGKAVVGSTPEGGECAYVITQGRDPFGNLQNFLQVGFDYSEEQPRLGMVSTSPFYYVASEPAAISNRRHGGMDCWLRGRCERTGYLMKLDDAQKITQIEYFIGGDTTLICSL